MADLIIHDVPDSTRDALTREALIRGQSLQEYLFDALDQWAAFSHNREILSEVERHLATSGGGGPDAPSTADLIREARAERDEALYRAATGESMPESARDPLLRDAANDRRDA